MLVSKVLFPRTYGDLCLRKPWRALLTFVQEKNFFLISQDFSQTVNHTAYVGIILKPPRPTQTIRLGVPPPECNTIFLLVWLFFQLGLLVAPLFCLGPSGWSCLRLSRNKGSSRRSVGRTSFLFLSRGVLLSQGLRWMRLQGLGTDG